MTELSYAEMGGGWWGVENEAKILGSQDAEKPEKWTEVT